MSHVKSKSILGYQLKELLGSGGYGEVWSAEAPGGLQKAVKLVYGYHDDHRAQTEMKALERIKQIRHPFLLSLERIDIHEGQLVIVSELADGHLADIHGKYVREGDPGIPRDVLLPLIRDAAEALDYLSSKHSLQHLDVKPDNLLVIGDHVKLADFGLVKDINQTNQSLVTGLSPIYAAPEIFDGRPSSKSDQYSLAVVYQEMLTSTRPFTGDSSAQLAVQHLNEKPDLRSLPKSDQPLLARALSKDPRNRFGSCLEFVSELANRKLRKKTVHSVQSRLNSSVELESTSVLANVNRDQTEIVSGPSTLFQEQPVEKLGPPDLSAHQDWFQPTLLVAIGGMATRTAQQLKAKMTGRHGVASHLPSIRMVCLDTDHRTFETPGGNEDAGQLSEDESLCLRLKTPEHYRNKSPHSMRWLSRRWIYNIPKSLQTEGIRPLGRLAFSDHFDDVCDSLRNALQQITLPENIVTTSETLEATPAEKIKPRVIVVCSMNGGASGMLFDIGYLLRTLLMEEGHDSESITAVLSHSIGTRANKAELSTANSLATFSELRHHVDCGYPGDDSLGIPSFEDQPFGHVYFHELAEEARQSDLREQIQEVSEWLYLNSMSNAAKFFDACRASSEKENRFDLRTFGMKIHGPTELGGTQTIANQLASDLIVRWLKNTDQQEPVANRLSENHLKAQHVSEFVQKAVRESQTSSQINKIQQQAHQLSRGATFDKTALMQLYDEVFGIPNNQRPLNYQLTPLERDISVVMQKFADQQSLRLSQTLDNLLDRERFRIEQVRIAVEHFQANAREQVESLTEKIAEGARDSENILQSLVAGHSDRRNHFDPTNGLKQYHDVRYQQFVQRESLRPFNRIIDKTREFLGLVSNSIKNLVAIRESFCEGLDDPCWQDEAFSLSHEILEFVDRSHAQRLDSFEEEIYRQFVGNHGKFSELLNGPHLLQRTLPDLLSRISTRLAADALRKISIDKIVAAKELAPEAFVSWMNDQLTDSLPIVRNAGGNVRLLLGTPEQGNDQLIGSIIARYFNFEATSLPSTCGDLVFCFEGDEVSLASIAARMVSDRPRILDLSERLHCRQDIKWSRIHDLF